jgi:DNA polymerase-3 subunit chi
MSIAIQFYQLLTTPLHVAMPALVNKAVTSGFNICITTGVENIAALSDALWEQEGSVFLPNCVSDDASAAIHPIILSEVPTKTNQARLLIITNGLEYLEAMGFERVLFIFDGNDATELTNARNLWKQYKNAGMELIFYEQQQNGTWSKK